MLTDKILANIKLEKHFYDDLQNINMTWQNNTNVNPVIIGKIPSNFGKGGGGGGGASTLIDLSKMLMNCIKEGDSIKAQELISKGAPFTCDWLGTTALHFAAMNNDYELCDILIRAGINKDAKTKVDRTPLHICAYEGHEKTVDLLISKNCDIDARDMLKMTPLHWAIEKRHKSIARLLLKQGADTTVQSKFNKTPITLAIETGQIDLLTDIEMAKKIKLQKQQQSEAKAAVSELELNAEPTSAILNLGTVLNDTADDIITETEPAPKQKQTNLPQKQFQQQQHHYVRYNLKTHGRLDPKQNLRYTPIEVSPSPSETMDSYPASDDESSMGFGEPIHQLQNIDEAKQLDTSAVQILKQHGISMLPETETENTLLNSALQGGRRLILSEAGKMVLNEVKKRKFSDIMPKTKNIQREESIDEGVLPAKKQAIIEKQISEILQSNKSVESFKANKQVKVITMEMFKKMCGNKIVRKVQKITPITHRIDNNIQQVAPSQIQINNKNRYASTGLQETNRINCDQSVVKEETTDDDLPPNIIEICSDSETEDANIGTDRRIDTNMDRQLNGETQQRIPSTSVITEPVNRCERLTSPNVSRVISQPIDIFEVMRQIYELRKQMEELQKQFELSQKQNDNCRARIEKLEKANGFS